MANNFNVIQNQIATRHFGGSKSISADPYQSGTFFIWFTNFPAIVKSLLSDMGNKPERILASLCTGVTPAGGTVNKVEYTGLGGIKWGTPGSVEYGTSVTLKFLEMQGTPIRKIISKWVRVIKDNRTGVTHGEVPFKLSVYSGSMLYWTTTPDGNTIETAEAWDGVFPLKDPKDLYPSSIETVDKIEPEIEFNVNRIIEDPWVTNLCQTKMQLFKNNLKSAENNNYSASFGNSSPVTKV